MEFKIIHITYCDTVIKLFTCTAVDKFCLTVIYLLAVFIDIVTDIGFLKAFTNIFLMSAVEYRSHHLPAKSHSCIAEMNLKYLTDIHT